MFLAGGQGKGLGVDLALLAGREGIQQIFRAVDGVNKANDDALRLTLHGPASTLFGGDVCWS